MSECLDVAWRRVEAVIGNELRIMVLKVMVRVSAGVMAGATDGALLRSRVRVRVRACVS